MFYSHCLFQMPSLINFCDVIRLIPGGFLCGGVLKQKVSGVSPPNQKPALRGLKHALQSHQRNLFLNGQCFI